MINWIHPIFDTPSVMVMVTCNQNIDIFSMTLTSQGKSCSQQPKGWLMLIRMTINLFLRHYCSISHCSSLSTLLFHLLVIKVHSKPCGMVSFTELLGVCSMHPLHEGRKCVYQRNAGCEGMQAVAQSSRIGHITQILCPGGGPSQFEVN